MDDLRHRKMINLLRRSIIASRLAARDQAACWVSTPKPHLGTYSVEHISFPRLISACLLFPSHLFAVHRRGAGVYESHARVEFHQELLSSDFTETSEYSKFKTLKGREKDHITVKIHNPAPESDRANGICTPVIATFVACPPPCDGSTQDPI